MTNEFGLRRGIVLKRMVLNQPNRKQLTWWVHPEKRICSTSHLRVNQSHKDRKHFGINLDQKKSERLLSLKGNEPIRLARAVCCQQGRHLFWVLPLETLVPTLHDVAASPRLGRHPSDGSLLSSSIRNNNIITSKSLWVIFYNLILPLPYYWRIEE